MSQTSKLVRVVRCVFGTSFVLIASFFFGPHRFLTISERLSVLQTTTPGSTSQTLSYRNLGANGSSSNVFAASEPSADKRSSLVGTDYILNVSLQCDLLSNSRLLRSVGSIASRSSCFDVHGPVLTV